MRQTEQDGEHIWLRQSVTFTVNEQTRTVEMTIPVRPGAPAEEIEHLLAEAEAGMQQLAHRLDSHVASLLDAATAPAPASAPPAPTASAPAASSAPAAAPRPSTPAAPEHPAAARPERPAAAAAPARTSAPAATNPPSRPAPTPAAPPDRSRPSGPLAVPASAAPDGGELSRKDFIAATTEMGLTIKQVMERLRVRTLEGLNLNEALEALRRQMLRDGETAQTSRPAAPATSAAAPSAAPKSAAPRYFEEEDDNYDVTFTVDGDDALSEEFSPYETAGMSGGAAPETSGDLSDADALDDFDLDDVPDFGPPPTAHSSSHAAQAPTRRAAPARTAATPPAPPATPAPDQDQDPAPDVSPEAQRVTQLRAIRGGGAPTTHQRTAYRNIVVNELGEPEAVALVRGVWRVNPERLGPEQLDALISWGKQDTFAEEAAAVLTTLRAERQQAAASENISASASGSTPRPAPRARPPQPPRAPSGGR